MTAADTQSRSFGADLTAYAAPLVFVLFWSGGYAAAKLGLRHAEPMTFLALRYLIVLLILLVVYAALRPPLPRRPADVGHIAVVGALVQALYFGMSYLAFSNGVSAGGVALIVSLQPILVAILAPTMVGERVGPRRWLGLALGLAGAVIVIVARDEIGASSVWAVGFAVIALFAMTMASLYEKRFGLSHHLVSANLIQYAVGLALVGPIAWTTETMVISWTGELAASLAYLVIANSLISVSLLLMMIRKGEVSRVSALLFLVPPMAALIAWAVIGEAMPLAAWPGLVLAAAGVLLASLHQRRKAARKTSDGTA